MKKIKLVLVDDQKLVREGLAMVLSLCKDFEIVGEASNGLEAIDIVTKNSSNVDVVLMDIRMPIIDGIDATKEMKQKFPKVKIIILTTFNEDEYILKGLRNGADGYILKDIGSEEIIKGIKTVYSGNVLLQPEIATKVIKVIKESNGDNIKNPPSSFRGEFENLSPREVEISKLVSEGKNNKEICEILYITEGTVKNHISRILGKLELRDRTQLALFMKNQDKLD